MSYTPNKPWKDGDKIIAANLNHIEEGLVVASIEAETKELPSAGSAGQVLTKTSTGVAWEDIEVIEYTAGNGINITSNEISIDPTVVAVKADLATKQDKLVSGANIKTINNNSILEPGNLDIHEGKIDSILVDGTDVSIENKVAKIILNHRFDAKVDKVEGKGLSTNDFTTEFKTKLEGIEEGANRTIKTSQLENDGDSVSKFATEAYVEEKGGKIDTIKVNGTEQPIIDKVVNIAVPTKVSQLENDAAYATLTEVETKVATEAEIRSNVDIQLNDRIDNLEAIGRYLSTWNCIIGKAETDPLVLPYTYKTGDYYIISKVGTKNYKPDGSQYTGIASTVEETEDVQANDFYIYDSTSWKLLKQTQRAVSFSQIQGNARDNDNLNEELNKKSDATNLKNGTGANSVQQIPEDFTLDDGTAITAGASGEYAVSLTGKSQASGKRSLAHGTRVIASGDYSHAEGNQTQAIGANAHAEGIKTTASGDDSHTEGSGTQATAYCAHAEGTDTIASGMNSHTEGNKTQATGRQAHAEGLGTIADTDCETAVGIYNKKSEDISGVPAFVVGNGSSNTDRSNAFEVLQNGVARVYGTPEDTYDVARMEEIDDLSDRIAHESQERAAEDNVLRNLINTETTNRQSADTNLQNTKQDTLVSGTNIKTINTQSILGSGNIDISSAIIFDVALNEEYEVTSGPTYAEVEAAFATGKTVLYKCNMGEGILILYSNPVTKMYYGEGTNYLASIISDISGVGSDICELSLVLKSDNTWNSGNAFLSTNYVEANPSEEATTTLTKLTVDDTTYSIPEGKTYTAGINVQISDANVISATDTTYAAGTNITIDSDNKINLNTAIYDLTYIYRINEIYNTPEEGTAKCLRFTNDSSGIDSCDVFVLPDKGGHSPAYTLATTSDLTSYVPITRTINNKALSSDITLTATDVGALPDTTTIPTALSQLTDDETHRLVTDAEKTSWNNDFLPLTAGSAKPLTGALTIQADDPQLFITKNGAKGFKIRAIGGTSGTILASDFGVLALRANASQNKPGNVKLSYISDTEGQVIPEVDATTNLGTSDYKWKEIHGTTIYQNGNQVQDKYEELSFDATGWTEVETGKYTKTITSTRRPVVCYNSNNEVVFVTLSYNDTSVIITATEAFAGHVLVI